MIERVTHQKLNQVNRKEWYNKELSNNYQDQNTKPKRYDHSQNPMTHNIKIQF